MEVNCNYEYKMLNVAQNIFQHLDFDGSLKPLFIT